MFAMKPADRYELEAYRALGTLDEIRERLANPYPQAEEGFAPRPSIYSGPDLPDGQYSGLLEDGDEFEPGTYDPYVNRDWEEK